MKQSMAQANWSPRNLRKSGKKQHTTLGKDKGIVCQASAKIGGEKKTFWAKKSRSYKHPNYTKWLEFCDKLS